MSVSEEPAKSRERIDLVQTVQTPLGFFVLVVLVVEAILGVTAASDASDRATLVAGMLGLIFLLVGIVAFMAYRRPEALLGRRPPESAQEVTSAPVVLQVKDPRVLCAATSMFMPLGFDRDAEIIRKVFGRRVRVAGDLNAATLRNLLMSEEFDVVHLLAYVDPSDGALVLDRDNQQERIPAQGLANLLEICKAKVIVLAVCDSIVLAAHVSRQANVIAATTSMDVEPFIQWATCFYKLLARGHALSRAYDIARATTDTPMVLLMKQDLAFTGVKP